MKNKSRATKAKKLGLAGILAAGIGLSGCETTGGGLNQGDIASVFLGTYASTPAGNQYAANRRAAAELTAAALSRAADAQRAKEVAEAGAARVEQNVNFYNARNTVRENNMNPLEIGKYYDITYTSPSGGTYSTRRILFNGFVHVQGEKGTGTAYEFRFKDGTKFKLPSDNLLSVKESD